MKSVVSLLLLLSLCCPLAAFAELTEDVNADFLVVNGYLVMPINDEYIVDLDGSDNLYVGDILTVVAPGKKILHPETGEIIGSLDSVLGFLQVTRILSGYSYAKVISDNFTPATGAPIKRFEQVPALFVENVEDGGELARQVQVNLPQFQWLAQNEADQALLTFTLQDQKLDVTNQQGDLLHKYIVTDEEQLVSATRTAPRPSVGGHAKPQPKLLQQLANSAMGVFGQTNESRFAEMDEAIIRKRQVDRQGIWMGPNLSGSPSAVTVADLDGDGQQETAVVLNNRLLVARIVAGEFTELAEVAIPARLQVLGMDAVDLDGNGRAELYLSALNKTDAASLVVEFTGENYEIVIRNVRFVVRALAFPGEEGVSLLGQRKTEAVQPFYGKIFHVQRDGDRLLEGNAVPLPKKLNIFNFQPFADQQNQINYAYQTNGDYLKVISKDGQQLWESPDYFGGSANCYHGRPEFKDEMLPVICMPQRMVLMPGNEVLAVQNDGQRVVKKLSQFKKSRLVAMGWDGYTMLETWRTASQAGYLADFAVADADNDGSPELVMAIRFQKKGIIDDARSSIVTYELD